MAQVLSYIELTYHLKAQSLAIYVDTLYPPLKDVWQNICGKVMPNTLRFLDILQNHGTLEMLTAQ